MFWESKTNQWPELYFISQIVLAVPPTQVTVERAFSGLSLVLTNRRCRLTKEFLSDILTVKLNSELFCLTNLNYD